MKQNIKKILYRKISQLGLPRLLHKIIAKKALTIITYHGITNKPLEVSDWCFLSKDSFCEQIRYLKKHFAIVKLSKAIELIKNGQIENPTATITFDDGYKNNYSVAYPILKQLKVPATIFLATGYVDTNDTIWSCRLHKAISQTKKKVLNWNGRKFKLDNYHNKSKNNYLIQVEIKKMSDYELKENVKKIIQQLGENPEDLIDKNSPYSMLESELINEMVDSGLIEFGAHTHSHSILSKLKSEDKEKEIKRSIEQVRKLTSKPCKFFAYPNGNHNDYDNNSIMILENEGIMAGLSMIHGPNFSDTPLMHLKRYGIGGHISIEQFQSVVHHVKG